MKAKDTNWRRAAHPGPGPLLFASLFVGISSLLAGPAGATTIKDQAESYFQDIEFLNPYEDNIWKEEQQQGDQKGTLPLQKIGKMHLNPNVPPGTCFSVPSQMFFDGKNLQNLHITAPKDGRTLFTVRNIARYWNLVLNIAQQEVMKNKIVHNCVPELRVTTYNLDAQNHAKYAHNFFLTLLTDDDAKMDTPAVKSRFSQLFQSDVEKNNGGNMVRLYMPLVYDYRFVNTCLVMDTVVETDIFDALGTKDDDKKIKKVLEGLVLKLMLAVLAKKKLHLQPNKMVLGEKAPPIHQVKGACFDSVLRLDPQHLHKDVVDERPYKIRLVNIAFDLETAKDIKRRMESDMNENQGEVKIPPHMQRQAKAMCQNAYNPEGLGLMYSINFDDGILHRNQEKMRFSNDLLTPALAKNKIDKITNHDALVDAIDSEVKIISENALNQTLNSKTLRKLLNVFLTHKMRTRSFGMSLVYPVCLHTQPSEQEVQKYLSTKANGEATEKMCLMVHGKGLRPITEYTTGIFTKYTKHQDGNFNAEDALYAGMGMDFYWGVVAFSSPAVKLACDVIIYYKYNSEDRSYLDSMVHEHLGRFAHYVYANGGNGGGFIYAHSMGNPTLARPVYCASNAVNGLDNTLRKLICPNLHDDDIRGGRKDLALLEFEQVNANYRYKWIDGAGPIYGSKAADFILEKTCILDAEFLKKLSRDPGLVTCSLSAIHLSHKSQLPRRIIDGIRDQTPLKGLVCGYSKKHSNSFLQGLGYGGLTDSLSDFMSYTPLGEKSDNAVGVSECQGPFGKQITDLAKRWGEKTLESDPTRPNHALGKLISNEQQPQDAIPYFALYGTHYDTLMSRVESRRPVKDNSNHGMEEYLERPAQYVFCLHLIQKHNMGCHIRREVGLLSKKHYVSISYNEPDSQNQGQDVLILQQMNDHCWIYCAIQEQSNYVFLNDGHRTLKKVGRTILKAVTLGQKDIISVRNIYKDPTYESGVHV